MRYCYYILYSSILNKYYVGATSTSVEERLEKHLVEYYDSKKFTSQVKDWKIVYIIDCKSFRQAVAVEKYIKSMKSYVYIKNLQLFPEITERLLVKYKL